MCFVRFWYIKEGQLLCVERGFPNESSKSQVGDKREEDEKRDDYFSLCKKRTFALFFRSRIVLFFALPFDFVSPLIS